MLKTAVVACALVCAGSESSQVDHTLGIQEQARGMARLAGLAMTCGWTKPYEAVAMEGLSREIVEESAALGQEARSKVDAARLQGESAGKLQASCADASAKDTAKNLGQQTAATMALRVQALLQAEKKLPYSLGLLDMKRKESDLVPLFIAAKRWAGRNYVAMREIEERLAPKVLSGVCSARTTDHSPAQGVCPVLAADEARQTRLRLTQAESAEAFARSWVNSQR